MSFRKDTHIQHHSNVVNIKQHNEQISTNAKLDTLILSNDNIEPLLTDIKTNTGNIKASIEVGGDLYVSQDEVEAKLDTINSTLSSGIGGLTLPSSLTGSGNLKVSLQELGNEGSERLNVDVGSTVSQLPTALTGEGNLKVSIQEDFTHNLSTSDKQDTINTTLGTLSTHAKQDTINTTLGTLSTHAKQDTTNGKLDTINGTLGDIATESTLQIIAEEFTKCDTDNVVITGGVVLPSALTGGGNLKVCIQELGNEGSERLNVDVGNAVAQLPTALSGSGRLKIENDFTGAITNTGLTNLNNCIGSNKVNVNISSGGFDGAVSNAGLTSLADCIGTDNSTGPAKCISIGGTNLLGGAIQEIACDGDGHLQVDILSSALPSGAAGEVSNSAIASSTNNILTKTTLLSSAEVKTLLSGITVNAGTQSTEFDTENYERVRFFGESTASVGTDIILMGSNVSGGTFYVLGENLRSETISGVHYVYGSGVENLPRYIKILNKHGSNNYVFTKLYFQGSGGRLNV